MAEIRTHKVVRTQVVETEPTSGKFAVIFSYDDRTEDFAIVGDKKTAEFYARVQKGETFPVGANPLLLNETKAEKLRGKG
jgi:hypothetical protein